MATFEKVGKRWKAIIRKKGFPKKTKTFDTKREASVWAFEYEQNLKAHSDDDILKDLTFATLIKRYLAEVSIKKKSAEKEKMVLSRFLREFPEFANKPAADIAPLDIAKWRDERLKTVKEATVARDWSRLSAVFSHSIKSWGLPLRENPFSLVTKPRDSKSRNQRITNNDIADFMKAFDFGEEKTVKTTKHKTAWCFLFAIETGMRAGEILKLKNENINGRIATLLDTKNGEDRKVPLSMKAIELIEFLPNGFPVEISSGVLDATFRKHRPPHLRHINFHDTRHEALSRLAKKIQNPMDLAKISGHKDLKILLNTYYNPDDDHLVSLLD